MNPNYKPCTVLSAFQGLYAIVLTQPQEEGDTIINCLDKNTEMKAKGLVEDSFAGERQTYIDNQECGPEEKGERERQRQRDWDGDEGKKWMDMVHSLPPLPKSYSAYKQFPCQLLLCSFLCSPIRAFNERKQKE